MSDAERVTPDLVIRTRGHATIVRLKLHNLTNVHDVNRVEQEIRSLIENGHRRLALDLKNVQYAGSAALGMLLALAQFMKSRGGKLVLSHPETIAELLRLSKTERLFTTAPDPKAALALLAE
jgi:anti-anti-sigma factor